MSEFGLKFKNKSCYSLIICFLESKKAIGNLKTYPVIL